MPVVSKTAAGQILEAMLTPTAVVPTADGLLGGILPAAANLQVFKVTPTDANHILTLPPPAVGSIIVLLIGATACKLISSAPATVGINGGTGAGPAKATMPAAATVVLICEVADNWKAFMMHTSAGTLAAVPAAA